VVNIGISEKVEILLGELGIGIFYPPKLEGMIN
jgi:hypothetical protein